MRPSDSPTQLDIPVEMPIEYPKKHHSVQQLMGSFCLILHMLTSSGYSFFIMRHPHSLRHLLASSMNVYMNHATSCGPADPLTPQNV